MRADTLTRFDSALRKIARGKAVGLLGLRERGSHFSLAYTAGAPSVTAAGHASLCSGFSPSKHGIVGNEIFDPQTGQSIRATEDNSVRTLMTRGLLPGDPLSQVKVESSSAHRMKTNNLADVLYSWSGKTTKSVSMSIKDRGSVFCGGRNPAGVYWYDYKSGSMVSSTAFTDTLPEWVNNFNTKKRPAFNAPWKTLIPLEEMRQALPDERAKKAFVVRTPLSQWFGEGFPYEVKVQENQGIDARQRFQYTPAASEHLVDFALEAVMHERLGCASRQTGTPCRAPEKPDLLTISFSTTDLVGHAFGPESPELMDIYLNLNGAVERLRNELEKNLGAEKVLFVFSSDHGVQSLPEVIIGQGNSAGRLVSKELRVILEKTIQTEWGDGPWIAGLVTSEIHFRKDTFSNKQKSINDAVTLLRKRLKSYDGIRDILSRDDIFAGTTLEIEHYKRGHDPERSGDAVVLLHQGWLMDNRNAANHGTAHDDDTRIPVVFSGWNVRSGATITRTTRADDVVPTILGLIGAPKTEEMTGRSFATEIAKYKKN
jgi:predicted AlkP superfamily pyrophosphatase or phosphodiesterase